MTNQDVEISRIHTVSRKTAIRLLDGDTRNLQPNGRDTEILTLQINSDRGSVDFRIAVQDRPAPLAELAILARSICDRLLAVTLQTDSRHPVTCRKGCATCCSYLVALSGPEVFQLRREFAAMPTRQSIPILKASLNAAFKILRQGPDAAATNAQSDINQISRWYAGLNLTCPFLQDHQCSIYPTRPLACREHFVASDPRHCRPGSPVSPQVISPPVSVAEALAETAAKLENEPLDNEAVMLSLAIVGTDELSLRAQKTYPASHMTRCFLQTLEKHARRTASSTTT